MVKVTKVPKIDKEEAQEGEIVETEWDIKKILIGLFVVAVLVTIGGYIFFPGTGGQEPTKKTLGVSTSEEIKDPPPIPDKEDVEKIISNAKDSLSAITSDNVTSSGSAIQKVIDDLHALQGKAGAIDLICSVICKDK